MLAAEPALGRDPGEQPFNNPGFDVLSHRTRTATRFASKSKARIVGADDFLVTHNEVLTARTPRRATDSPWSRVRPRGPDHDEVRYLDESVHRATTSATSTPPASVATGPRCGRRAGAVLSAQHEERNGAWPLKRKLIEVALPLEAINRESAREKSIRHGHPSTLHLWWARRPLAAARAVLFAQLVDDPSSHPDAFPTEEAQQRRARATARASSNGSSSGRTSATRPACRGARGDP